MDDKNHDYPKLDMSKIKHKATPVPMLEALKQVTPMPWDEFVLRGEKKVRMVPYNENKRNNTYYIYRSLHFFPFI